MTYLTRLSVTDITLPSTSRYLVQSILALTDFDGRLITSGVLTEMRTFGAERKSPIYIDGYKTKFLDLEPFKSLNYCGSKWGLN